MNSEMSDLGKNKEFYKIILHIQSLCVQKTFTFYVDKNHACLKH